MFSIIIIVLPALSFIPNLPALQISSCIKYETYIATQYKMAPLQFSDVWFRNSFRYSPQKVTRMSFRSRRLFGCCDPGYEYIGFQCEPICFSGCGLHSHCSAPNLCTCDFGYHKNADLVCVSNEITTTNRMETTLPPPLETTTPKIPCNGSCKNHEICSQPDEICICQNGYQRYNETSSCIPKCDNGCENADCTSPNNCTCWPHYEPTNDSSCHLKCTELSCAFGECDKNGTCACAQGFFNNGTYCIWAGEDMFSEPDYCDCWSKFLWQKNVAENHCMHLCDEEESTVELTSGCIPYKECEFFEGYIICHSVMFKCIDVPIISTTEIFIKTDKVTANRSTSTEMTFLIMGLLAFILVVGAVFLFWKKRNSWFNRLWKYNTMESTQEEGDI